MSDKEWLDEGVIIDDTTLLDYITVNGRISKKLFQKVIEPKLEQDKKEIERLKVVEEMRE